jgi:hypothetical protein
MVGKPGVLQTLEDLPAWCATQNRAGPPEAEREQAYFQNHREQIHYQAMVAQGYPNGSAPRNPFARNYRADSNGAASFGVR